MEFSERRKFERSLRVSTVSRGEESLVPDSRNALSPVDCIERKLGTLLPGEVDGATGRFAWENGARRGADARRRKFT